MRLQLERNAVLIIPESVADKAFLEDSLGAKTGEELVVSKVHDVELGFKKSETWCLKIEKK